MHGEDLVKTFLISSGVMLLIAIADLPYGYYQFLRLVIFVGGLISAFSFYEKGDVKLLVSFTVIALLFNPIVPVYMGKNAWRLVDLVTSIFFFYTVSQLQHLKK